MVRASPPPQARPTPCVLQSRRPSEKRQVASGSRHVSALEAPPAPPSTGPRRRPGARLRPTAHAGPPTARGRKPGRLALQMPALRRNRGRLVGPLGLTSQCESGRPGGGVAAGTPGWVSFPIRVSCEPESAGLSFQRRGGFAGRAARQRCAQRPGCRRRGPRWCCGCPSWTCSPR